MGTLHYMSPEQVQGKEIDARSDLFSFGLVLYEMLTGRRAFDGENSASVIAAILARDPASLEEIAPVWFAARPAPLAGEGPGGSLADGGRFEGGVGMDRRKRAATASAQEIRSWLWPAIAAVLLLAVSPIPGSQLAIRLPCE